MKTITTAHIPEEYKKIKHASGLEILLYPMEGFSSSYALFATKYGSVDTTFKTSKDADYVTVPEGIAHFLEHKLFENEDGVDTFERYAKTGASANAFTSFDRTAYLFGCTDQFKESLEILLDFVTHPYFTPETVEKEQGIIGQEITMYQDDPDWRVFFGMLESMYQQSPVRIDIAGTIDTIAQIDVDLLYRCYHTFYNLHNMVLVVAGNFQVEDVLEVADRILQPAEELEILRKFPQEPKEVLQPLFEERLAVAQPLFQIGFKRQATDEQKDFITAMKTSILLEVIAGEATDFYQRLYKQGLINATFSASSESGRGYAHSVFSGEARDPKAIQKEITQEILRLQKEGLDPETFSHSKKAVWGRYIGIFGSVSGIASLLLSTHFVGLEGFQVLDVVEQTTLCELEDILRSDFDVEHSVLSVIYPEEDGT